MTVVNAFIKKSVNRKWLHILAMAALNKVVNRNTVQRKTL